MKIPRHSRRRLRVTSAGLTMSEARPLCPRSLPNLCVVGRTQRALVPPNAPSGSGQKSGLSACGSGATS
jgi:hypothetical protein